jgi:CubicO group peptidase (beta-lactamase class C family)
LGCISRWDAELEPKKIVKDMNAEFYKILDSYAANSKKIAPPSSSLSAFVMLLLFLAFLCLTSCSHDLGPNSSLDDWKTSSPAAQNINPDTLANLAGRIEAGVYGEIHSLLIVRHGYLVYERYFRGYRADKIHPVYSVTKSVTSLLIGIASDRGEHGSLNQSLLSFFPEYRSIANMDSRKQAITLRDVLTMRAGFDWNEGIVPYGDPRNPTSQLASSNDWIKFMLDRPMSDAPGARFRYNSGCSVLLSGIIRNKTGSQAQEYAVAHLFRPLAITSFNWERGPQGISNTGWGLSLRPRDMAKIGLLCLNQGEYNGTRVLSQQWLNESTTAYSSLSRSFSYGYQWWLLPLEGVAGHTPQPNDIIIAWGWGDQFIFVIPHLDLVVVSTAGNYSGPLQDQAIDFVRRSIIKAVKN